MRDVRARRRVSCSFDAISLIKMAIHVLTYSSALKWVRIGIAPRFSCLFNIKYAELCWKVSGKRRGDSAVGCCVTATPAPFYL